MRREFERRWPLLFGVAAALLLLGAALLWYPPLWQPGYAPAAATSFVPWEDAEAVPDLVDLNTAPAAELEVLPGIGEKRAAAIVAHREANGPFESLGDLKAVEGIGEKRAAALEGLVRFSQPESRSLPSAV